MNEYFPKMNFAINEDGTSGVLKVLAIDEDSANELFNRIYQLGAEASKKKLSKNAIRVSSNDFNPKKLEYVIHLICFYKPPKK